RLECRHDLRGELPQILNSVLLGVENGKIKGDEGGVVAHTASEKLLLNPLELLLGFPGTAQAEGDLPFRPVQPQDVQRAGVCQEKASYLLQQFFSLLITFSQAEAEEEVVAGYQGQTWLCLGDFQESPPEETYGSVQIPR